MNGKKRQKDPSTLDHDDDKLDHVGQQESTAQTPLYDSVKSNGSQSWREKVVGLTSIQRVASALSASDSPSRASTHGGYQAPSTPWQTAFIRFGPLSGILCMFLAIASVVASLGILAGSDRSPVAEWSAPPSTYLAIFTAIANVSMRFAAINGVAIAWWFRASKGSTLAKLHYDWRSGTTISGALTSGRHTGLLALACISSTLVVIDGPFLQRASTVVSAPIAHHPTPLNIMMAPEIPTAYGGTWGTGKEYGETQYGHSPAFNGTVPSGDGRNISNFVFPSASPYVQAFATAPWMTEAPLFGVAKGCSGVCKAKILAPAFVATSCTTQKGPTRYKESTDTSKNEAGLIAPPLDHDAFISATSLVLGEREAINLVSGYGESVDCEGTFTYKACTYEAAVGEYDAIIKDDALQLESPGSPKIIALANNTMVNRTWDASIPGHQSTLGAIAYLMWSRWDGYAALFPNSGGQPQSQTLGGIEIPPFARLDSVGVCASYRDPHETMYRSLNSLAVYVGARAAVFDTEYSRRNVDAGLELNSTITGYLHGSQSIYRTNYWYFLVAALIEVGCICLVAPTYWGWWTLGRELSFSPLEIAKAFNSPLLADVDSNSSARAIAFAVGDVRVRYGAIKASAGDRGSKLGFGDVRSVTRPQKGVHFDV